MRILHQILTIHHIEPFRVTCLWNNGEVRTSDFASYTQGRNERLRGLADVTAFQNINVQDGTLQWPDIQVLTSFRGELIPQPLTLDPEVLYEESTLVGYSLRTVMSFQLRQARLDAGFSQTKLAALSGTTKEYISRIESGKADFQVSTFDRILQKGLGKHVQMQVV
jgi:DNA-binding XRE family transcriptional regulator